MPVYFVAQVEIHDADGYNRYSAAAASTLGDSGARVLALVQSEAGELQFAVESLRTSVEAWRLLREMEPDKLEWRREWARSSRSLADVLRLSQAMTYKHALAGTRQGGGKAVILGDSKTDKTPALLHALGRHVDTLGGRYIVAEDVGTSVEDMGHVRRTTRHVAGDEDPSPVTAYGVFHGIKAAVRDKLGRAHLDGLSVAVQGLGHVGYPLCGHLHEAGARLFVADTDGAAVARAVNEFSAVEVAAEEIYGLDVDVFAPCALGGVINDATIPRLKSRVVAGAANNQLARAGNGWELAKRGILYAPDYVINAGGIISISLEGERYDRNEAMKRAEGIYDTVTEIFRRAAAERLSTNVVADRLALERIGEARRTTAVT